MNKLWNMTFTRTKDGFQLVSVRVDDSKEELTGADIPQHVLEYCMVVNADLDVGPEALDLLREVAQGRNTFTLREPVQEPPPPPDPRVVERDKRLCEGLDAYGHLTWVVGYGEDGDERGDWLACFDFEVENDPVNGVVVAYETVVNSDSGGFIDTIERQVVTADKAPFNLPTYWMIDVAVAGHGAVVTDEELAEAKRMNEKWNEDLRQAIEEAT